MAENGKTYIPSVPEEPINNFACEKISEEDVKILENDYPHKQNKIPVIEALDGELITNKIENEGTIHNGYWVANAANDVLKLVVVNRYHNAPVAKGFIRGFGLQRGAIASSVAHDSHNIIAVGVDDKSLVEAVNKIIDYRGGISFADMDNTDILPLPVAGLMSTADGYVVAKKYTEMSNKAKSLGSTLKAPYMTLSFMALLVIPHLKLSDKGLFDGDHFQFIKS